jgi:protein gp37
MGEQTAIAWTDHTFNPWWGCTKVPECRECDHCYAETFDKRVGGAHWGPGKPRRFFKDAHWAEPEAWDRAAAAAGVRRRVFCASMGDVFDSEVDESWRMRLWGLIEATPNLDWLLLTKRPEVARFCIPAAWSLIRDRIWIGTSAGTQASADRNIPPMLDIDAAVHFVSMEPLIERVEIEAECLNDIDWIIVGGESGAKARPMDVEWARAIRDDCRPGVAFFMKQMGGRMDKRGEIDDLPEDLRIREFPSASPEPRKVRE